MTQLLETMSDLQSDAELTWRRLSFATTTEFDNQGIKTISETARLMYLKSPLVNRGVNLYSFYTFGQGLSVTHADPRVAEFLRSWMHYRGNGETVGSQVAQQQLEVDVQCDGNVFFALPTDQVTGAVAVRIIPLAQIAEIVYNPDDSTEPWFYRREWYQSEITESGVSAPTFRAALYPALGYDPKTKPLTIGGVSVVWGTPVLHGKVGSFNNWSFGLSPFYSAIDWAIAYKSFLEDWATVTRQLARYAFKVTVPGGKPAIAAAKSKLATTISTTTSETNPPPVPGSTFIQSPNVNLEPLKTSGAQASMDDGRRLLLMVCSAFGLPETFFGDASVGSLATAKSLDRPTELQMRARQTWWRTLYEKMATYAIGQAARGALRGVVAIRGSEVVLLDGSPLVVSVTFPPVVAPEREADVAAVVAAAPLIGSEAIVRKMVLQALQVGDLDGVLAEIEGESA